MINIDLRLRYPEMGSVEWFQFVHIRDWSPITGGGGATKREGGT